jgi:hypothetical protein
MDLRKSMCAFQIWSPQVTCGWRWSSEDLQLPSWFRGWWSSYNSGGVQNPPGCWSCTCTCTCWSCTCTCTCWFCTCTCTCMHMRRFSFTNSLSQSHTHTHKHTRTTTSTKHTKHTHPHIHSHAHTHVHTHIHTYWQKHMPAHIDTFIPERARAKKSHHRHVSSTIATT